MSHRIRTLARWLPPALWASLIFYGSSLQASKLPGRFPSELGHLGEYAVLGALLFLALRTDLSPGRALAVAVIVASLFGMSDEFHQSFVPTRTPDIVDWGLDTLGAALGAAIAALAVSKVRRPHEPLPTGDPADQ